MICKPTDVSINLPDGPSGPSIPGFGVPFALKLPNINPFPDGFPEDLLDLLNKLQMLVPPGSLYPQLNPNFGKDIFDAIMKLMDQFMPFLMMYKFFLPLLKLLLCVIEVICSLKNPRKTLRAIKRLFRVCIPEFLNLFPLWALIIMIISLLLLLLALIEYIINQIIKLIKSLLRNIIALKKSFEDADDNSILAIAQKLGSLLCIFQNLFVLLALINIVVSIFRDILSMSFAIPPCSDNDGSSDGCCTSDVCPDIVKTDYKRYTGSLQYYNKISTLTTLALGDSYLEIDYRDSSLQLYDVNQEVQQAFANIIDAYDITSTPKPVFFPTDSTYTANTPPLQAAYTFDLRMYYNPANFNRTKPTDGIPRWIQFKDCIMLEAPKKHKIIYDNTISTLSTGVSLIGGGLGYEDDGTILNGYASDGVTKLSTQAILESFIMMPNVITYNPNPQSSDGYLFNNIEYTFKPNYEVLWSKDIITAGCIPDISLETTFVSNVLSGNFGVKLAELASALQVENGFPDPEAAQECMTTAVSGLRGNLTIEGVAQFQTTTLTCMEKLKNDTNIALGKMVGLGFDACSSTFVLNPERQFTTLPIKVTVDLKERNGYNVASNLTSDVALSLAQKIKGHATFGNMSNFAYDGYTSFTADITSTSPGSGQLMVSFDDNIFCTNTLPSDVDEDPLHTLNATDYRFVYTPTNAGSPSIPTTEGDATGQPRRDEGDAARIGHNFGGKDGV